MIKKIILTAWIGVIITIVIGIVYIPDMLNNASPDFPIATDIAVEEGMTLRDVTNLLKEKNVVRSSLYLHFVISEQFEGSYVQAGIYHFESPLTTEEVARTITSGTETGPLLSVTFPEGFSVYDIKNYLPASLSTIDTAALTSDEGYLFPDTYFISKDASLDDLTRLMKSTFEKKIESVEEKIVSSGLSNDEVIILASIIEREAKDNDSKKLVAGILRNRLEVDMPLQVDAAFTYILGKTSAELTQDDLTMDSPYNTYIHKGLPPTPISNPGMESILAVLEPEETEYFYYLTDDSGVFHYAKTFDEHKRNKSKYLR